MSELAETSQKSNALTGKMRRAAILVAEDEETNESIATQCGIAPATLTLWKRKPAFQAAVNAHRAELAANLSRFHIARKDKRVGALQDRWEKAQAVIGARAKQYKDRAPGAETGIVVPMPRVIGQGSSAQTVIEWAVDTALLAELRAMEKQAAQEVGQWTDRTQTDHTSGGKSMTDILDHLAAIWDRPLPPRLPDDRDPPNQSEPLR